MFDCYVCFLFTVSSPPPFFCLRVAPLLPLTTPLPPTTTSSTTVPLSSSFQASRANPPLPHIGYCSIFICCTRHMLLLCYNPNLLHSLSLSPLDYFPISYVALYNILQQWTLRFASHRLASEIGRASCRERV